MRYIIIFILVLMSTISYGGTVDPAKKDSQYIEFGSKFNYVFRIKCVTKEGLIYYASATAIDEHWILTAAHVVHKAQTVDLMINDRLVRLNKITPHKDFIEANFGFYDIALCHVDEKLNLEFYPKLYTNNDEVGKICSIAGFGSYGTFETGATSSDGKRRAGSNRIEAIDRHLLICKPSRQSESDRTELEFIIANGDSGGGLFIGNEIAGVNSCVMAVDRKTDSNYGDEGCHTRVSQFVDWIKENKK